MKRFVRVLAVLLPFLLLAAACSSDDGGGSDGDAETESSVAPVEELDLTAIGLWDDGPCDESVEPLRIGLMTVFESPLVSLGDQATALEAAAEAFNARGGANGACLEVHTCDDGANADQALACVDEIDEAGVVVTVNDQGTAGQGDVSEAMNAAGIPRLASNVASDDWGDQNAYPLDASGTGGTFVHPSALLNAGVTEMGLIRVDLPEASALIGLLEDVYTDDGLNFVYDTPVPAGTTDYTQFVLGAQDAGAQGVQLSIGEQEAVQVINAAEQLGSDLQISVGLGTVSHAAVTSFGDISEQMHFTNGFPPATYDLPAYDVLRADLAASGEDDLQPENLRASPMRSWIGLYALLYMIRDSGLTDFTRENVKAMIDEARDIPMLGIFGDVAWTPDTDHPGVYQRAGIDQWISYDWDPEAANPVSGLEGNFVETGTVSFDEIMCGSPLGGPEPC